MATDEEWTSGKNTLSTENVVFAQTIIGLQKQFGEALTDLVQKIYIAIYSYTNEFNVNFKNILLALNAPRGISLNFYMENMQNINNIIDGLKDLDIPKQTIINMFWPELADQVLDAQILIQQLDKEAFRKQSQQAAEGSGGGGGLDFGGMGGGGGAPMPEPGGGGEVSTGDLESLIGSGEGGAPEGPPPM